MSGHPALRVALCQIDTVPGDIPGNLERIRDAAERARVAEADVALFPEMALLGYSPRDLLYRHRFIEAAEAALVRLAPESEDLTLVVGTAYRNPGAGRPFYNGAVVLAQGEERARVAKTLLPDYDVFDEARYFEPGDGLGVVEIAGVTCGISICEDMWVEASSRPEVPRYVRDPVRSVVDAGAEVVLNISASPFCAGRPGDREELVVRTARRVGRPLVLCNLVGGNDDVLFDGSSVAVAADGTVLARAASFEEDLLIVDLGAPRQSLPPRIVQPIEDLHSALVLGIHDYARKCGFERAVLGLSGGVDSAVSAVLAVDALGADQVTGITMPSRFSSPESVEDARELAERLGIAFHTVPIEEPYEIVGDLARRVVGEGAFGIMEENIQARLRGVLLMAVSNRTGALLITTGNKSEIAVGYCTLYGDMSGGLAAISDVYKTQVYALAERACSRGLLPRRTITKPPSAELRPDQKDEDSLPPYAVLDRILELHVEESLGARAIGERLRDLDPATIRDVLRLVARSEYKRKQAPPGIRVTAKAFGVGRRIPMAASTLGFLDDPEGLA